MKKHKSLGGLLWGLIRFAPAAQAAGASLPGAEAAQPYLAQSPVQVERFAADPLGTLRALLPGGGAAELRAAVQSYADVLLFLLLAAVLAFLCAGTRGGELLDLAAAGGCGVLLWRSVMQLAQTLCERLAGWQRYLLGFLPVYAGVITAGGEPAAGSSVTGLLLTSLCFLAQMLGAWVEPLLQCYLALSIACCISAEPALAAACRAAGRLLRQGLALGGKLFVFLLGVQRVFTMQLDRSSVRMARLLTGSVPVVGQTLSDAAETALAGLQLLKSSLGLAALCTLGAEFVPLYLDFLLQLGLLSGCGLLCELAGIRRCRALFDCLVQAVQCMAAVTALFFGIAAFGTVLMFLAGGGG